MKLDLKRTVSWHGEVSYENFTKTFDAVKALHQKNPRNDIFLNICSCGGSTPVCMAFYDLMKVASPNLITICAGTVASAGVIIWLAGSRRYIMPHATIFLHEVARDFGRPERCDTTELRAMYKDTQIDQDTYATIIAESSKIKHAKVVKMLEHEVTLTAPQAVKLGLAHGIWKLPR